MSLNSHSEGGAGQSGASASVALARLPAGGVGYAAWAAGADVSLERAGALGIHRKPMTKEQWVDLAARVDAWREEELSAAIALTGGAAVTVSLSGALDSKPSLAGAPLNFGGAQSSALSAEAKEARRLVGATVERSRRVYGMLYAALPEELRPQVAHLPQGWAHGLWQWLETKFQSTEQDSVGELLARWTTLRQEESESFDAYRARVNQLRTLLEAAKEKPSARMYAYMLLDRLQARYKPAILALKAGGQLKDAEAVAWDTVTALINAHERQEQRIGLESQSGDGAAAMAAAARSNYADRSSTFRSAPRNRRPGADASRLGGANGATSEQRGSQTREGNRGTHGDPRRCFRCNELGHVAADCEAPRPRSAAGAPPTSRTTESAKAAVTPTCHTNGQQATSTARASGRNRFDALSSDDDAEDLVESENTDVAAAQSGPGRAALVLESDEWSAVAHMVMVSAAAAAAAGVGQEAAAPIKTYAQAAATKTGAAPIRGVAKTVGPVEKEQASSAAAAAAVAVDTAPVLRVSTTHDRTQEKAAAATRLGTVGDWRSQQTRRSTTPGDRLDSMEKLDAMLSDNSWGWDTMASACCSGNRALFVARRACAQPVPVKLADHSVVHATHVGSVVLRLATDAGQVLRIELDNVLYHPRFGANLLSGELLTKKLGWQYHSTPEHSYVLTPGGSRITLSTRGRVAVLVGVSSERACAAAASSAAVRSSDQSEAKSGEQPRPDSVVTALVRLHARLLHCGWTRMMHLLHSGRVLDHGFDLKELTDERLKAAEAKVRQCTACLKAKATRTPFGHRGLDRGTKPCEVLHMDTYVVKHQQADGQTVVEYALTMKDMHSGHMWHATRATKDRITEAVVEAVLLAETQFGCTVKRLRSDGGSEFVNRQMLEGFCAKRGKRLHWTPKETQQLNGAAERSVRTFKECARAVLHHAGAPLRLFKFAAAHAAFVWNRTHISADTRMTPYEALRGKQPSLRHIGVFGCDVYRHVPKHERASTLAPNVEPAVYLGHHDAQNAARVLLIASGKVITSRDVTFRSDNFAFMRAFVEGSEEGAREAQQLCSHEQSDEVDDSAQAQGEPARSQPEEYVVESIVGQRRRNGRVEYKVRWRGYGSMDDSWEPEAEVKDLAALDVWLERQATNAATVPAPVSITPIVRDLEDATVTPAVSAPRPPLAAVIAVTAPGPTRVGTRQSPRLHPSSSALRAGSAAPTGPGAAAASFPIGALPGPTAPTATAARRDESDENVEPKVHMAMSALRQLQLPDEQPEESLALAAVATGVATLEQRTPTTYREAMASPDALMWRAALEKEMRSCTEQQVWTLVRRADLPPGANVLPCKEVFKIKVDERGEVTEFKARFTPKGFRQKYGKDFFDTFARTGQYKTLRVVLSLVAKWDHEMQQFDVPTAFLNAPVDEDIYMELPAGFEQAGMVCKLLKSLYGLRQAPRNWDRLVHRFITGEMAFRATVSDPSLYFRRSRTGRVMLIYRFVDDMQGSRHEEDAEEFAELVALLRARFNIKQLKTATWMLGMRITRDRQARTITLDQELYVTKALERFGFEQCRPVSAPEAVGAAHDPNPDLDKPADAQRYMEMTGTLMYAAISTRPDIAHAVHYLASHMQAPTARHMQAAERAFRYLAGTKDVGLIFGSRGHGRGVGDSRGWRTAVQVDVCAFADADWANDKGDRRSVTGWVAKLNGDPVSWSSKKQRVVALSTCEAELYAEAAAIQEVLWLRGLMEELGLHTQTGGSAVYGDNQSAIAVSQNGVKGERTKHVDVKYHFVTETVERGVVTLRWVPTAQQQADIFTKALPPRTFDLLRSHIMTR